ncbi:uncharacterized protein STEHIDRAFT_164169 [Stereum hirsutum FP-91666 SS1]|uniref:Uncharacterized protein n=1 Tax=Stereum hirsutum (strain FP-91666) TaxID=721885 RepID=R7RVZ6_STEHR|nr:uncharacterized protein STEHIDRAFT_164169 [Stereum hirsutum FP-91666 SS1]EIM78950.1 hypothetical protein STEHIDRAFT_164169 [Stereum hirsutum FP-91666 SS1]
MDRLVRGAVMPKEIGQGQHFSRNRTEKTLTHIIAKGSQRIIEPQYIPLMIPASERDLDNDPRASSSRLHPWLGDSPTMLLIPIPLIQLNLNGDDLSIII